MAKKQNSKVVMEQKRRRRAMLTFWRVLKYGANSFLRNAWLSVAATAVMTVTLTIMLGSFTADSVLNSTLDAIKEKVDMSIYLKKGVDEKTVEEIRASLEGLESVERVSYLSPNEARKNFAKKNSDIEGLSEALGESSDEFFGTFNVKLVDIGDIEQLKKEVEENEIITKNINPDYKPTYATDRKKIIERISESVNFAEKLGILAASIFVVISSLIIFNTIRMAIFNRREEIYMMKLIGANKNFISGPFLVESVICGILASFFAAGIGYAAITVAKPKLEAYGIAMAESFGDVAFYGVIVLPTLMLIGAIIGILSSFFATRRYLKI